MANMERARRGGAKGDGSCKFNPAGTVGPKQGTQKDSAGEVVVPNRCHMPQNKKALGKAAGG